MVKIVFLLFLFNITWAMICFTKDWYFWPHVSSWRYINKRYGKDVPKITFQQFKKFFAVAPNKWSWDNADNILKTKCNVLNYRSNGYHEYVWFRSFFGFVIALRWWNQRKKTINKMKSMKRVAVLLSKIKDDVNMERKVADNSVIALQKEIMSILEAKGREL